MALFEVWAPTAEEIRLAIDNVTHQLSARDTGWWSAEVPAELLDPVLSGGRMTGTWQPSAAQWVDAHP